MFEREAGRHLRIKLSSGIMGNVGSSDSAV